MSIYKWRREVWNPVTGCTKYSDGCANCYAESMALRLKSLGVSAYSSGFSVTLRQERLNRPLLRKRPTLYFVVSMGDLFHRVVPYDYIDQVVDIIRRTPRHCYQLLTKRSARMFDYFSMNSVPSNLWLGVSVENKSALSRVDLLRSMRAPVRFIFAEPLLGDLGNFSLDNIDWVMVGGESGLGARPMREEWVLSIKALCESSGVSFFFSKWGVWGADGIKRSSAENGSLLQGKLYKDMPDLSHQYSLF